MTWVEHVEVDHKKVHQMYKPIAGLGLLFGAKRWVATLDHQCERLALVMAGGNLGGDGGKSRVTCVIILLYQNYLIVSS